MGILNLSGGGAFIRFMPQVNAWVFGGQEVAIKQIVVDHDTARTGWGVIKEGAAPEWIWTDRLGAYGSQPSPDHKKGFSVILYTKQTGKVEWSSTGTGPCMGFDVVFEEIWNGKDANPGKVAVIEYTGSEAIKVGKGNTRRPLFKLVKWVDRANIPWGADAEGQAAPKPHTPPVQQPKAPASSDDEF